MVAAFKAALGSATATTSGNTLVITTTAAIALGDLVVVRVATDNLSATTPTFTAMDSGANTYTTSVQKAQNATPNSGAACAILATRATTAMIAGGTITVVLSGAVNCRAAYAESFTGVGLTVRASNSLGQAAASTSGSGAATPAIGDLVLGVAAVETSAAITGDPDTTGGPWSAMAAFVANTGTSLTSMSLAGQWKVSNAAVPSNYNVTWSGVTDYAGAIVCLVPEVWVPPVPTVPPGHVDIGGLLFCVPAHGVAVRIEVRTPTQLLDVTDSVVRATWQQGGAYDAAGSPWFNPTPNPCELELVTADPKWDPTTIGAYDLTPLATNVRITLAEEATNGPGLWSPQHKFYGPLLAHTYEPTPGGGAVVQITAADALTNLGDMIVAERGEESPYARLSWLASGVKDLDYGFSSTAGAGPLLGRYHPDQGLTRLELMNDCALAAGQALLFQPTDIDAPVPHKTIVYDKPQGSFSNPGVCWLAAVDPENGMTLGGGDVPALGANTRVACLTDIALARQEQGFRTKIQSARTVAYWLQNEVALPTTVGVGTHQWYTPAPNPYWDAGDRWRHTIYLTSLAGGTSVWRPYWWTGTTAAVSGDRTMLAGNAIQMTNDVVADRDYPVGQMGRWWIQTTATGTIGAGSYERVERLAGTGTQIESEIPGRKEIYGERTMTGWRSPIARQTDLATWNGRALAWITQPTTYPRLLRVATSPGHPSPGAQQWAVQLWAGQRLALRHVATPASPASVTIGAWAVNVSTTLTPTEVTLDVECGPTTSGST